MTSKERMLIALNRQKPDRLPVTIHQWQPYHLKKYMNEMSDIEANKVCGLDASINFYEEVPNTHVQWKISYVAETKNGYLVTHYIIETPGGILSTSEGTNEYTTWVIEPLIKSDNDIFLLEKYRPNPVLNKTKALKAYDTLGDGGILRTFICGKQGGCWQDACELYGVEKLIMKTYDDPVWVHEFLNILLQKKLCYINDNLKGMPFDLIETGGGASSNTVISPALHEGFCLPYDTKMHECIAMAGHKSVYHTCGGMTKIADLIIKNHCDASETLSPSGVGGDIKNDEDARKLYDVMHSKVALIGGMDQSNILGRGCESVIHNEVERLFKTFGLNGGFILSACDHFFDVPMEHLMLFSDAAKECSY